MSDTKFCLTGCGGGLVLALASLGAAACLSEHQAPATEDQGSPLGDVVIDTSADQELNLLSRVRLEGGAVLEFYEPSPGQILISEVGLADEAPLVSRRPEILGMAPSELYRKVTGEPVPAALLHAEEVAMWQHLAGAPQAGEPGMREQVRVDDRKDDIGGVESGKGPAPGDHGCSPRWFEETLCLITELDDWSMCLLNKEGHGFGLCTGTLDSFMATCASIGNITMRVLTDVKLGGAWTVFQGNYRYFYIWGENIGVSLEIEDAYGDYYHATMGCLY